MNSPRAESDKPDNKSVRNDLAIARERLSAVQERLRINEKRIRTLEHGVRIDDLSWQDTVERNDAVIAAVAMIEISASPAVASSKHASINRPVKMGNAFARNNRFIELVD